MIVPDSCCILDTMIVPNRCCILDTIIVPDSCCILDTIIVPDSCCILDTMFRLSQIAAVSWIQVYIRQLYLQRIQTVCTHLPRTTPTLSRYVHCTGLPTNEEIVKTTWNSSNMTIPSLLPFMWSLNGLIYDFANKNEIIIIII